MCALRLDLLFGIRLFARLDLGIRLFGILLFVHRLDLDIHLFGDNLVDTILAILVARPVGDILVDKNLVAHLVAHLVDKDLVDKDLVDKDLVDMILAILDARPFGGIRIENVPS
jgi:hypothetical protein